MHDRHDNIRGCNKCIRCQLPSFKMSGGGVESVDQILLKRRSEVANIIEGIGVEKVKAAINAEVENDLFSSNSNPPEKGRQIVDEVIALVKDNPKKFIEFLKVLENNPPSDGKDAIKKLKKECKTHRN